MPSFVEVFRGPYVESRHRVHACVVRPDGAGVAHTGDPSVVTFWRSAAKFFQAVPLVTSGAADALAIPAEELALACASHNGEPRHVDVARRLLERSGSVERDLHCGPHPSLNEDLAKTQAYQGEFLSRLHSNCSGKHAGMLAVAVHRGWDKAGYEKREHPIQRGARAVVSRWSGVAEADVAWATDGCGVPTFALPVSGMALAYARLAAAAAGEAGAVPDEEASAVARLVHAVQGDPFLLAGTDRLDTDLLTASRGRILAKVGADGIYCAALLDQQVGVALKVEDGATRALAPALLAILDLLAPGALPGLDDWRRRPVLNSNDLVVGEIRARIELANGAPK